MPVSADPMLPMLREQLEGVKLGDPESARGKLNAILSNASIFGVDLYEAKLADKVEGFVCEMLAGPGAVRAALKKYLA